MPKEMKQLRLIFLSLFVILVLKSKGQSESVSMTYWVNQKYLKCINSGNSVSSCHEQNDFLILHIDTSEKIITLEPSMYYSWEMIELKYNLSNNYYNIVSSNFGTDSITGFNIIDNKIVLSSSNHSTLFERIQVKRIDKWAQGDIWRQLGLLNSKPLLEYATKPDCSSTELLVTQNELKEYISKGQIWISVSDDFYYNELTIKKSENDYLHFFLEYGNNYIKMYKTHGREKDEIIDTSTLNECQLFYLPKD